MTKKKVSMQLGTICPHCGLAVNNEGLPKTIISDNISLWIMKGWALELCLYCKSKKEEQ